MTSTISTRPTSMNKRFQIWIFLMFCTVTSECFPCPKLCFCSDPERVDCTGKNLSAIPQKMSPDITKLDLSMNNLTSIPDYAFSKFPKLTDLRLASNRLKLLSPLSFSGLYRLKSLSLQGNHLENIPERVFSPLYRLNELYLDANRIKTISSDSFESFNNVHYLRLDANNLTEIPMATLSKLQRLLVLDLSVNKIQRIEDSAFHNNSNLGSLLLHDNRIHDVGDYAFEGLGVLTTLELQRNRLTHVPTGMSSLPELVDLNLQSNRIQFIPNHAFVRNVKLQVIKLKGNPISSFGVGAFQGLPFLMDLILSEVYDLEHFPNVTGTDNLVLIRLDRASIVELPPNICQILPHLKILDMHSNKISRIPSLELCYNLRQLDLGNNQISTLNGSLFVNSTHLQDLTLSHNSISYIPHDTFKGLHELEYLDLAFNKISGIDPAAFLPLVKLIDLNLAENSFPVLPTKGLSRLKRLKTFHNKNLQEPLDPENLPNIQTLVLSYAYHCCNFINSRKADVGGNVGVDEEVIWLQHNESDISVWNSPFLFNPNENESLSEWPSEFYDMMLPDFKTSNKMPSMESIPQDQMTRALPPIQCEPVPGPFLPCDDLFGWWSLRCGVWIVFLLAVVGNGIVLFVSITARSKMSMDVPRFLICNLACADFCMGAYLGILAILDASTLDEFQFYAIKWQRSGGCLTAGFLGVISSMLSVFSLTVITIERYYAISNAMQMNKRVTLKQAGIIMTVGWLFCIVNASLPFFGISDYRKFAICLPFETTDRASLAYVCFLMLFNAFSFIIIMVCYVRMYCSIMGSNAWNSKDFRIAKRMAILVFTDFLCWAPIIFFSITAAFGENLIGLNEAKVLTIFVLPLNSCANPFLYAIFTKQFKRDCVKLCKRIEESSISRSFSNINSRRVSFVSSWRHSQLHSPFHTEKRSSISNSVSGGSMGGGPNPTLDGDSSIFDNEKYKQNDIKYHLVNQNESEEEALHLTSSNQNEYMCCTCNPDNTQRNLTVGTTGSDTTIVIHFNEQYDNASKTRGDPKTICPKCKKKKTHTKRLYSIATQVTDVDDNSDDNDEIQQKEEFRCKNQGVIRKRQFTDIAKRRKLKEKQFLNNFNTITHGRSAPNVQMPVSNGTLILPTTNSADKTSHINEWRKSSHLTYMWKNSMDKERYFPSYKSNSLVDLSSAYKGFEGSPCKRRSLSSRHEGYILLKSNNRDSAYEDEEEMIEYNTCKTFSVDHSKYLTKQPIDCCDTSSGIECEPQTCDKEETFCDTLHSNEKCQLLPSCQITFSRSDNCEVVTPRPNNRNKMTSGKALCEMMIPKNEVCDKESGFSSEA